MTSPSRIWFRFKGIVDVHSGKPDIHVVTSCIFDRDDPHGREMAWESARQEFRKLHLDLDRWDRSVRPIKIWIEPVVVKDDL